MAPLALYNGNNHTDTAASGGTIQVKDAPAPAAAGDAPLSMNGTFDLTFPNGGRGSGCFKATKC